MNRTIGLEEYQALVAGARVLEAQSFGVKVWELPDGRIVKLFRTKRLITSARLRPYSSRFARNARALRRRGFRTPEVLDTFHCPAIARHGVVYRKLPGTPMARLLEREQPPELVARLAAFLVKLHEKGVYFRSVHPGNVLLDEAGDFGLIDLQDVRLWPWPLGPAARVRNFRHLFHSNPQSHGLRAFGYEPFVGLYLEALPRSGSYRRRLARRLLAQERPWEA